MSGTADWSFPIGTVADWRSVNATDLTADQSDWLLDAGSLTAKLKTLNNDFAVTVIGQTEGYAADCEYHALHMHHERIMIREVLLSLQGQPWVFARSIIPYQQLRANPELTHLGDQPLGEHLFARKDTTAGPIEIAEFSALSGAGQLNQQLHQRVQSLWGRRRVFSVSGTRILVSEVFLSPTPCYS